MEIVCWENGRRWNFHSVPVIRGQKIDIENFDGKINFGMWRREVMDAPIQINLDVVLKNKEYNNFIWLGNMPTSTGAKK